MSRGVKETRSSFFLRGESYEALLLMGLLWREKVVRNIPGDCGAVWLHVCKDPEGVCGLKLAACG